MVRSCDEHFNASADARALLKDGKSKEISTAMMAITTQKFDQGECVQVGVS